MQFHKILLVALCALFFVGAAPTKAQAVDPYFFSSSVYLSNGVYYSDTFGYFNVDYYYGSNGGYIYKYNFGYLYYLGDDGGDGDYFYDFNADDYFYTADNLYPYIYSFYLDSFLYYYENSSPREFYNFRSGRYIYY